MRHSTIHVHATESQRSPSVFMLSDSDPIVFVTIPPARVNCETVEDREKIMEVRVDAEARLYLTIEQAVRMATDILATTMYRPEEARTA